MAGPFKMKGSPMQKNFGIGGSPLQKNPKKILQAGKKIWDAGKNLIKKYSGKSYKGKDSNVLTLAERNALKESGRLTK